MAEAVVVEERPQVPTRFFCHMCNVEINIPNTDYTCPLCAGGFVEELPNDPAEMSNRGGATPATSASVSSSSSNMSEGGGGGGGGGFRRISDLDALRGELTTLLMSRNGPNVEISIDPGSRRSGNVLTLGSGGGGGVAVSSAGGGGGNSSGISLHTGGGRVRPEALDRLDHVLLDFLQSLSGGDMLEPAATSTPLGTAASQMFFMGNPGDYAWGREGIDTIVTQLLNQMETSGPPPLAKDKIAEIPKIAITADEVEKKLQCSVCWEDFRLEELVRKLPCTHIYHEQCIVPWLDLHGTCPICRKSLTDDGENDGDIDISQMQANLTGGSGVACPYHSSRSMRQQQPAATAAAVNNEEAGTAASQRSTSTIPANVQQQQQQQRNTFGFDDDNNIDLD